MYYQPPSSRSSLSRYAFTNGSSSIKFFLDFMVINRSFKAVLLPVFLSMPAQESLGGAGRPMAAGNRELCALARRLMVGATI